MRHMHNRFALSHKQEASKWSGTKGCQHSQDVSKGTVLVPRGLAHDCEASSGETIANSNEYTKPYYKNEA